MEGLSDESRTIYDLIKASTSEEFDAKFLEYEQKTLGAVRTFVVDTEKELRTLGSNIDSVRAAVNADLEATRSSIDAVRTVVNGDLEAVRNSIGGDLDAVKDMLSAQIESLASALDRVPRPTSGAVADRPSTATSRELGSGALADHSPGAAGCSARRSGRRRCAPRRSWRDWRPLPPPSQQYRNR